MQVRWPQAPSAVLAVLARGTIVAVGAIAMGRQQNIMGKDPNKLRTALLHHVLKGRIASSQLMTQSASEAASR